MERQNERISNMLRVKSQHVQMAEKKLKDLLIKREKAQKDRNISKGLIY